jgi:DNA-directed RNA polymerase I, II, and III subunit RPABC2
VSALAEKEANNLVNSGDEPAIEEYAEDNFDEDDIPEEGDVPLEYDDEDIVESGDAAAAEAARKKKKSSNTVKDEAERKIPKEKRTTTPYMTKYERARVLGTRALQIR